MLAIHWSTDAILGGLFVAAALVARDSFFVHTNVLAILLFLIFVDHILLANGAGYLYIVFDVPIMLLIAWRCFSRLSTARMYADAI